jgi:hypothetical protein
MRLITQLVIAWALITLASVAALAVLLLDAREIEDDDRSSCEPNDH